MLLFMRGINITSESFEERALREEMEEANDYQDLSLLPLDEEHKVNKEDIYY